MAKLKKKTITDTSTNPIKFSELDIKHDLTALHFSQGIYCLGKSVHSRHPIENSPFIVSSVIHFYFAIEAVINLVSDDIILNKKSKLYIKPEDRGIELRKFFANWNNTYFEEKLTFLIERFAIEDLTKEYINEIKELNRLRNLIVHNKIYRSIYTQPETIENARVWEVDYELKTNDLFPKTKFNLPVDIDPTDAIKAFKICLKLLIILSTKFPILICYHLPSGDARTFSFIDKNKTLEEHEIQILALLASGK